MNPSKEIVPIPLVIIGAGAAGMAAAIFAAGTDASPRPILLLDGAKKPGVKILVSGGGRCNVTNKTVTAKDFNASSSAVVKRVLKAFDNRRTIAWMEEMGVSLKLEETGKYFPVTDKARTVLAALQRRIEELGVELRSATRVGRIIPDGELFRVELSGGENLLARRVIVATGGLALPKSGSDGAGLQWMRELGLKVNPVTPALAPLIFGEGDPVGDALRGLSGLTTEVRLTLHTPGGARLTESVGSALFTHFGMSGPAAMDLSRHFSQWVVANGGQRPVVRLALPGFRLPEDANGWLVEQAGKFPKRLVATILEEVAPARLAAVLGEGMGRIGDLRREERLELARRMTGLPIPVVGDRGYPFAETTAGGVDLSEVDPVTMEVRRVPGLHLCGEILDVDGRIGGFNFQWAWASGYLAGRGAG
ncbi:MAG: aminoacetone oxidase family FAD-binding enzyme [Candidatus Sumerlaeia bacterium]|nr:aminoacetone oxidase family FAD-binding enzyme [Candidatus Sumerlaeia bacterium]